MMRSEEDVRELLNKANDLAEHYSSEPFAYNRKAMQSYWQTRASVLAEVLAQPTDFPAEALADPLATRMSREKRVEDLLDRVSKCESCVLHKSGTRCTSPHWGEIRVPLIVVVDSIRNEDERKMLTFMLENPKCLGLPPAAYNVSLAVRCAPNGSYDNWEMSADTCAQFTHEHIFNLDPAIVLVMGSIAARQVTVTETRTFDEIRRQGATFHYYPVVVTYGLDDLRVASPEDQKRMKKEIWLDLLNLREKLPAWERKET